METINFEGQTVNQNPNEAPKAPNDGQGGENNSDTQGGRSSDQKRRRKLIWAGIVMAALILSVAGWQYWRYTSSMYYQQMKAVKTLEKMEKESDKWGGKTPEETVRLFTEAVKKGDFELASKYGVPETNVGFKLTLEKIRDEKNIDLLVKDLENGILEESPGFAGEYVDLLIKENGKEKYSVLTLYRSDGGIWKIVEF